MKKVHETIVSPFLTKCFLDSKFNQIVQSVQIMDMYLEKGNLSKKYFFLFLQKI
jgi:hypothetical protein